MNKLASLIIFASILTAANFQDLRATNFGESFAKNEVTNSHNKSVGEPKLAAMGKG